VNTGDQLVLIDAGSRGKMQPTAGRLLQNLASAEIKPEDIDTILITHAHPDHLWGVANASDTERTFPNAEYVIGEAELNFWMQPQHLCVPKTKSERIDDEVRPRWLAKLRRRIAEPDERPAHRFAKTDAF